MTETGAAETRKWLLALFGISELVIPLLIMSGRVPVLRGVVGWIMLSMFHAGLIAYFKENDE